MPAIVTQSADNPEFARTVDTAKLRGLAEFAVDLAPTPAESAGVARLMGAQALRKLRFHGRLTPAPAGAWLLEAELGATAIQTCVVTLDPVTTRVDITVRRLFTPGFDPGAVEIDIDDDADDEVEPLADRIDLGLVAIEALALALPAYPRRTGARLAAAASPPPGDLASPEAEIKPFAALAALRAKLSEGS